MANTLTNCVIRGRITNTSNKISDDYKGEKDVKTAYLYVIDEDRQRAEDFGLKFYTPKDGGEDFAVTKLSANLVIFTSMEQDAEREKISCEIRDENGDLRPNWCTTEGEIVMLNLVKGEKKMKRKTVEFIRLQSILLTDGAEIEEISMTNPFADLMNVNEDTGEVTNVFASLAQTDTNEEKAEDTKDDKKTKASKSK